MKIVSEYDLAEAAACLRDGGLVAFPTETVYGLGANALNALAVAGIFEAKKRPSFDPLIVHIYNADQLETLFEKPINSGVARLAEKFWPGPLTIVHQKSNIVPDIVTSDLDAVAVRMPSHPVALHLLELAGVPVAAPSANLFGQLSPTSYLHVAKQQMDIDFLIRNDDSPVTIGIESTVVSVEDNICTILRPGVITADEIKQCLPDYEVLVPGKNVRLVSPGLLNSHYSPVKPLYFCNENTIIPSDSGIILHVKDKNKAYQDNTIFTSETGNLLEVAANLFSCLHRMEENKAVSQIFIAEVEPEGIGRAIMDRLNKATYRYSL